MQVPLWCVLGSPLKLRTGTQSLHPYDANRAAPITTPFSAYHHWLSAIWATACYVPNLSILLSAETVKYHFRSWWYLNSLWQLQVSFHGPQPFFDALCLLFAYLNNHSFAWSQSAPIIQFRFNLCALITIWWWYFPVLIPNCVLAVPRVASVLWVSFWLPFHGWEACNFS